MEQSKITLKLSLQQALVFFEWLGHLDALEPSIFQHPAEQKVLWHLEGQLESTLSEPLVANYKELLAQARTAVEEGAT